MTDQKPLDLPWDRKPEPSQVLGDIDLHGKSAVITGGYSGIGLEAVKALADRGLFMIVPARNKAKAEAALSDISNVVIAEMDLKDLNSVRRFGEARADEGPLDLLINNAGIMACPLERVGPGWESQFAVNHLGHFALTEALLPALRKAEAPRVVALSSLAHRITGIHWDDPHFENSDYDKWVAYGQSKTANALFARALDRREDGLLAFSVHPGGIMTDLQRHLTTEEMQARGWVDENGDMPEAVKAFFKTPSQGASTTLFAATSPHLEGHGGVYLEDCNIAALVPDDADGFTGVKSWACSDENAARLWSMTEEMLANA